MKEFTLTAIYEAVCQCHDTVDDYTFNNAEEVEQYKREKVVFNRFRQEWHEYEYGCEYEEKIRVFLKLISAGIQTECLQGRLLSYLPQIQEAYSKYCRTEFQTWRDMLLQKRLEVYTMLKEEHQAEVRAICT